MNDRFQQPGILSATEGLPAKISGRAINVQIQPCHPAMGHRTLIELIGCQSRASSSSNACLLLTLSQEIFLSRFRGQVRSQMLKKMVKYYRINQKLQNILV